MARPAVGLNIVNTYLVAQDHAAHDEQPKFVPNS